ncbi:hypothetical protein C8J56DRAFT_1171982 [Mycena floridula]|nr:hypothetical protein C8J56DRAFT_1171982 [Mycena floridula]
MNTTYPWTIKRLILTSFSGIDYSAPSGILLVLCFPLTRTWLFLHEPEAVSQAMSKAAEVFSDWLRRQTLAPTGHQDEYCGNLKARAWRIKASPPMVSYDDQPRMSKSNRSGRSSS